MINDETPLSPNDLFLSLHGTVIALITALHRSGQLPVAPFLEQMKHSELSLREEGEPAAAELIQTYAKSIEDEIQRTEQEQK